MKLRNLFLATIAIFAMSCSTDENTSTVDVKETNKVVNTARSTQQTFQEYTKLLKDLYGAQNYKIKEITTHTNLGQSYEVAKVVNKHNENIEYGYLIKVMAENKTYYLAHNALTGILNTYSTTSIDNYTQTTYDLKKDSYYYVAGFNPFNNSNETGRRFWGKEKIVDCDEATGMGYVYYQQYILWIAVGEPQPAIGLGGGQLIEPCAGGALLDD